MFDNNKTCKRCIEEKGKGDYKECPYENKDCHNFILTQWLK